MRKKNDFELGELVDIFMRQPAYKDRLYLAKIREFWKKEMGTSIANSIRDMRLIKGKLYIRLESSVIRQELQFAKSSIIEKMNVVVGEEYVREVVFG